MLSKLIYVVVDVLHLLFVNVKDKSVVYISPPKFSTHYRIHDRYTFAFLYGILLSIQILFIRETEQACAI
jgi:hypothetical protein